MTTVSTVAGLSLVREDTTDTCCPKFCGRYLFQASGERADGGADCAG